MLNNNKPRWLVLVVVAVVFGIILSSVGCGGEETGGGVQPAKQFNIRCQTLALPDDIYDRAIIKPTLEALEKASGGRIEVKYYYSGEVVPSTDLIDALGKGTIDLAFTASGYYTGLIPSTYVEQGLAFTFPTYDDEVEFFELFGFEDFMRSQYAKYDVHFLAEVYGGYMTPVFTKPFDSLDDLKGRKIRAYGPDALWADALGMKSTYIPMGEIYTALQLGTVDGFIVSGPAVTRSHSWHEYAKYEMQPIMVVAAPGVWLMSKDLWNELTPDLQEIFDKVFHWGAHYGSMMQRDADQQDLIWLQENAGYQVITLSSEDEAAMIEAARQVWEDVASKGSDAAEAVDMIMEFRTYKGLE